jgi:hypothetical protein
MERLGGLLAVLAEADPEIAEVTAVTEAERLTGVRAFVGHLAEQGHLRSALSQDEVAGGHDHCHPARAGLGLSRRIRASQVRRWR